MSKENKPKGKIRVFLFELEGTDETLLESVRSIAGAVNRTFSNNPRVFAKALAPADKLDETEDVAIDDDRQDIEVIEEEDDPGETRTAPTPKAKRPRRYPTPQPINDLDLKKGEVPFAQYCKTKNLKSDTARYVVIAAWLKDYRGVNEISIDHVYTCYRLMNWTHPQDMPRVFRNAKRLGYFAKGVAKNHWAINHIGENKVAELDIDRGN